MALFYAITNFASKMQAVRISVNPAITSTSTDCNRPKKGPNFYAKQLRQTRISKPADFKRFISDLTDLILNVLHFRGFAASVVGILVFCVLKCYSIMSVQTFRSSGLPPSSR